MAPCQRFTSWEGVEVCENLENLNRTPGESGWNPGRIVFPFFECYESRIRITDALLKLESGLSVITDVITGGNTIIHLLTFAVKCVL